MQELLQEESIVIRSFDKGSWIVIMNTEKHMRKVNIVGDGRCIQENGLRHNETNKQYSKKMLYNIVNSGKMTTHMKWNILRKEAGLGEALGNPKTHKNDGSVIVIVSCRGHRGWHNMLGNSWRKMLRACPYSRGASHFVWKFWSHVWCATFDWFSNNTCLRSCLWNNWSLHVFTVLISLFDVSQNCVFLRRQTFLL